MEIPMFEFPEEFKTRVLALKPKSGLVIYFLDSGSAQGLLHYLLNISWGDMDALLALHARNYFDVLHDYLQSMQDARVLHLELKAMIQAHEALENA
jgi:hypothetical protein